MSYILENLFAIKCLWAVSFIFVVFAFMYYAGDIKKAVILFFVFFALCLVGFFLLLFTIQCDFDILLALLK